MVPPVLSVCRVGAAFIGDSLFSATMLAQTVGSVVCVARGPLGAAHWACALCISPQCQTLYVVYVSLELRLPFLCSSGRGHKLKKKIHKLIKLIKIIVFIVVVKLKMVFVMFMLQTLFQAKLVAITFMILLIKKYYLWVEWKHKKEEKKVSGFGGLSP